MRIGTLVAGPWEELFCTPSASRKGPLRGPYKKAKERCELLISQTLPPHQLAPPYSTKILLFVVGVFAGSLLISSVPPCLLGPMHQLGCRYPCRLLGVHTAVTEKHTWAPCYYSSPPGIWVSVLQLCKCGFFVLITGGD